MNRFLKWPLNDEAIHQLCTAAASRFQGSSAFFAFRFRNPGFRLGERHIFIPNSHCCWEPPDAGKKKHQIVAGDCGQ